MTNVQEVGIKFINQPQTLANGATLNSSTFDILQFAGVASKLRIVFAWGATDAALTTLKLQGSNTNNGSDWADVDGGVYGTDIDINGNASTLPGSTDDNKAYGWTVNSNGGAFRYYRVVAILAAGSTGALICTFVEYGQRSNNANPQGAATGFAELLCVPPVIPATH